MRRKSALARSSSRLSHTSGARPLLAEIREMILAARQTVARGINAALVILYWKIGRRIYKEVLRSKRADYGAAIVATLSQQLSGEFGNGFSRFNLSRMIKFGQPAMGSQLQVITVFLSLAASAFGQGLPQPPTPVIPQSRDESYPGVLQLKVDATDLERHIFDVQETIPVAKAGKLTLLYPKWLPGTHSPRGTIHLMGGLTIRANEQAVHWSRDPVEITAFHVDVPEGVTELNVRFQFLSPVEPKIGRVVMTPEIINLQWLSTALYPAGHYAKRIQVEPRVKLPTGWGFGCALETRSESDGWVIFKTTDLETVMDSPIFAGRHYAKHTLSKPGEPEVRLHLVADAAHYLEADPKHIEVHRELVAQTLKLFGARHFDRYEFLVALSDLLGAIGLEHHRSSENRVTPKYFTEWDKSFVGRYLLAHEIVHSWNGKFRRPADLWTPDYHVPMRNSLLWVYEGQTTYWGDVLAARSGLMTSTQVLGSIAVKVADYERSSGRKWRSVEDTTHDPIIAGRRPLSWKSYQRSEDYYHEGALIWLDADTLIREKTEDRKSLDDFARAFFGIDDGRIAPVTYEFKDVVQALNDIVLHDWTRFLKTRLEEVDQRGLFEGITRGGYRLAFTNSPPEYVRASEASLKMTDFSHSLGFTVGEGNALTSVIWDAPAYRAGLTAGSTLVAVDGESYEADKLKTSIKLAARPGGEPIELLVKEGTRYRTVKIPYHDGLRYPYLDRIPGARARLDEILAPRK